MAEKQSAGSTFAITLSIAPLPSGDEPLGALVFDYSQVQNWLKAIRETYFRKYDERGGIRYIVCGERGSKKTKRIHWHVILFTDKPIGVLGEWRDFTMRTRSENPFPRVWHEKFEMPLMDEMELEKDLYWSLWPHGNVKVQAPGTGGVFYALKYAMMDQFTVEKSKGKNRIEHAHTHAASMFRMSKLPPIGVPYLQQKLARLSAKGWVLPNINIRIPGYKGFWFLTGDIRQWFLLELRRINEERKAATGKDAPQWTALLASVSDLKAEADPHRWSDREVLIYGPKEENWLAPDDDYDRFLEQLRVREANAATKSVVRRCGRILPCDLCWDRLTFDQQHDLEAENHRHYARFLERTGQRPSEAARREYWNRITRSGRASRGCVSRKEATVRNSLRAWRNAQGEGKLFK